MRRVLISIFVAASGCLLTSCSATNLENFGVADVRISQSVNKPPKRAGQSREAVPVFRGESYSGTGKLFGDAGASQQGPDLPEMPAGDNFTLNLLDVSVSEASKVVLGDMLGMNYSVASGLEGTITIQTSRPASAREIFALFRGALRDNRATLDKGRDGVWQVRALSENDSGGVGDVIVSREPQEPSSSGLITQIVPLQYVAAGEIAKILAGVIPEQAKVSTEPGRNALLISGKAEDIRMALDVVRTFDVDWMKGMSFGLFPVKTGTPETVVTELDQVFGSAGKGSARFIANKRLQAVLVIAPKYTDVVRAREWIKRLDAAAASSEPQTFVYKVQNRQAKELAAILQGVYAGASTNSGTAPAPEKEAAIQEVDAAQPEEANVEAPTVVSELSDSLGAQIKVVADDANNSLVIVATANQYAQIHKTLERIDFVPQQVLLEATIAEVALNDELKFGLKWFFEKNASSAQFSNLANGAVSSIFPGFNYIYAGGDTRVALQALSSITDVNVISSPSLMVLDNRTAVLQVGDQVPVATQSAVLTSNPNSPVVNTIELKDTGVILSVTPRVNDNGSILLDIQQEVSDVVPTTTSGIDSPTIQQRKIRTSVIVQDGSTLALGGMIQKRNKSAKSAVPMVSEIPVLGALFRSKTSDVKRTELIVLITPRVASDAAGAAMITQEFRQGMKSLAPIQRKKPNAIPEQVQRVFN
jgi:general secretion pathway protein D